MAGSSKRIIRADSVDGIKSIRNYAYEVNNFEVDTGKLKGFSDTPVNNRPSGAFTGTPTTLTKTYSSTNPLDLTKSLRIARSANAQGQGYYFTFQPMRRDIKSGAIYEIEFDHELISGTFLGSSDPTVLSDLIVGVWDAANSKHLDVSIQIIQSMVTDNVYTYKARFQLPVNGTTFNFWIYNPSTTATAFEIAIDNLNISRQVTQGLTMRPPVGTIISFGSLIPPTGFLYCNGQTVSRTQYSKLFAAIGTSYGSGDGSTTFHLPDLRGRFLRGANNGSGNDPDSGSRSASNSGGATGDNVGSLQGDAFQTHGHSITDPSHSHVSTIGGQTVSTGGGATNRLAPATANGGNGNADWITNAVTTGISVNGPNSGNVTSESRPKNVNVAYHICFDDGNLQISEGYDARPIVLSRFNQTTQSINNAVTSIVDFPVPDQDTLTSWRASVGAFNSATGQFATVNPGYIFKKTDYYIVSVGIRFQGTVNPVANSNLKVDLFLDNALAVDALGLWQNGGSAGTNIGPFAGGTKIIYARAGQVLDVRITHTFGAAYVLDNNSRTYISIGNIASTAQAFAASQKVFAKYVTTSGQSFNATEQRVNFGTMKYDNFGLVQVGIGIWEFTAKEPGVYSVKGLLTRAGTAQNSDFSAKIYYNSVAVDNPYSYLQLGAGNTQYIQVKLNSEDYLDVGQKIWVTIRDANNGSLDTNAYNNWIAIKKVS